MSTFNISADFEIRAKTRDEAQDLLAEWLYGLAGKDAVPDEVEDFLVYSHGPCGERRDG